MKIFRSILNTDQGQFLVDAEHDGGGLSLLRIHPVVDGEIKGWLSLCKFEGVEVLIMAVQGAIAMLEE